MCSYPPRVGPGETSQGATSQIARATASTLAAWFPVSGDTLSSIRSRLEAGIYDDDVEAFVRDVRSDYSLFTYCVRELVRIARADRPLCAVPENPFDVLRQAPHASLRLILNVEESDISVHRLTDIHPLHAVRFREAMVGAIVSEAIAPTFDVDGELAYATALFRQLGLTLVAWNYPHVFARVVPKCSPDSIDTALSRLLGFSPKTLGLAIATQVGLSSSIRRAMGDRDQELDDILVHSQALEQICRVGEAFARYDSDAPAEGSRDGWLRAKDEIRARLGSEGFKQLEERLNESCRNYLTYSPEAFRIPHVGDSEEETIPTGPRTSFDRNRYLRHLPRVVQGQIELLYAKIDPISISKHTIDLLVKDILPATGFTAGAVYLAEPDTALIVPRFAFGGLSLGKLRPLSYRNGDRSSEMVVKAFVGNVPLVGESLPGKGKSTCSIAGVLGSYTKAGVLYLEAEESLLPDLGMDRDQTLKLIFKALRQAMNDCLHLS